MSGFDFCHCEIDDVLVTSPNEEEHLQHLQIFKRSSNYELAINPIKNACGTCEVKDLGPLITNESTMPLPGIVEPITKMRKPQTLVELQRFLVVIKFYGKSIKNAALLQAPS